VTPKVFNRSVVFWSLSFSRGHHLILPPFLKLTQLAFNSTTNKFRIINFRLMKTSDWVRIPMCKLRTFFGFIRRYPRPISFWEISVSANFGPIFNTNFRSKFERLNFAILKLIAVELNASWV
jgi:hypothetical protein